MGTATEVLRRLESNPALEAKREGSGWKMNSPLRPGANSHSFSLTVHDEEHGAYFDHVSDEKGTLYQLATALDIALPERADAVETKRVYASLAEYAQAHGVPPEVFQKAGWTDGHTVKGRPAFQFMVNGKKRWRFKDGNKPVFISELGFNACWYGLDRAIKLAKENGQALLICNGEPSVVAGQYHGLPAAAESGGEKALRATSLRELREKWDGPVWICLDCDGKGLATAQQMAKQIPGSVIIDLKLGEKGDLGDFAYLHGTSAYATLKERASASVDANNRQTETPVPDAPRPQTSRQIAQAAITQYADTMTGKPLIMPFYQFRQFGGFAKFLMPKKVSAFVAMSGHGKTSFLETLVDLMLQAGEGGVWYGSEWDDMEYHWRRVHRAVGVTYEQLMSQELWKWEIDRGITNRHGVELTAGDEAKFLAASETIAGWRGQVQYFPAEEYLEDILLHMTDEIAVRRAAGEYVTFAVFDYIQLLNVMDAGSASNPAELALGKIKQWTERNNLHALVGSQVTKAGSAGGRGNKVLTTSDALFMRDDKTNLFVTLNHVYEDDIDAPKNPDGSTPRIMTNRAIAHIAKNNAGRKGNVHLFTDFPRLRWLDKGWIAETVKKIETWTEKDDSE